MGASSKATTQTNDNQGALAQQQQQTESQLITAQQSNDALINADLGTFNHVPTPTGIPSVASVVGPGENSILSGLTLGNLATSETEAAAAVDPNETGILATFSNSAQSSAAGLAANRADTLEAMALGQSSTMQTLAASTTAGQTAIANGEGSLQTSLAAQNASLQSGVLASSAASQYAMAQEAGGGGQGVANPLGTQISSVPSYSTTDGSAAPASSGISPVVILAVVAIGGGALWFFESHKKAA